MRYVLVLATFLILLSSFLTEKIELHPYNLVYPTSFGSRFTIPADNPTTVEGVSLGRMLFYEPLLSKTNTISCGNCHEQSKAFSDGRILSIGVSGKPTRRNSMSLANLLWVKNLFWDGRVNGLENQVVFPLTHPDEMGQPLDVSAAKLAKTRQYPPLFQQVFGTTTITGDQITKALAQFERTLISADSPYDRSLEGNYKLSAAEQRGMELFMRGPAPERGVKGGNCAHCHGGTKFFQEVFHNNGLDSIAVLDKGRQEITNDALDNGRFRVATLRNIALTAPYMHDGRFTTLEQVLDHYNEHFHFSPNLSQELRTSHNEPTGQRLGLTSSEKKDIVAFLHTLTDSTFITNPRFSNPFGSEKGKKTQALNA
jgi:cytochrome c peroxidase